jgi:hypothetical protein
MEGIEKKKNTLINIIRYVFGTLFLLICLGAILSHDFIAGLLFLLAAIVSIPPTAIQFEKKLNMQMSGTVRFVVVLLLVIVAFAASPNTTTTTAAVNNTTAIAAPPSDVNGSDAITVPSEPASTPTPIPDNKGTLDIVTSPAGATVTVDGISQGLSPVNGSSVDTGNHSVDLSLSGYNTKTLTINIKNSGINTIYWTFTPNLHTSPTPTPIADNKGTLDIVTNPTGATVTVDGISQGTTPLNGLSMDAGTHTVDLSLSGYDLHKETVNLANSEKKTILWAFVSDTSQSPTPAATPEVTPTEIPTTEVTPTATSKASNYQDSAWENSVILQTKLLADDMTKVSNAATNINIGDIQTYGTELATDSKSALDESKSYSVSSSLRPAKNKYETALYDFNQAGYYAAMGASNDKKGQTEQAKQNIETATTYLNLATTNMNEATSLLKDIVNNLNKK